MLLVILNSFLILVILILIIFLLNTRYSVSALESFNSDSLLNIPPRGKTNSFPDSEAHIFHEKQDKYGIAQCTYGEYTPILTCSYDSKI
jgi:hypothetical protein